MKSFLVIIVTVTLLSTAALFAGQEPGEQALPHVVVLATGGTIAGSAPTDGSVGYNAGTLAIDTLLEAVPEAKDLARLTGHQIASIGSQDMNDEVWFKLARAVGQQLASDDVAGVVITHGTDTMEETAFFLNLVVKSDKPVVLTGAMRPATALSAEGPLNLYNAVAVAAAEESRNHGVLVVANDLIHGARDVTKVNTLTVQAFESPNRGHLGGMHYGQFRLSSTPNRIHTTDSVFSIEGLEQLPRVDVIYAHANMAGDLIDAAVAAGARGIVLAGVGNGNASEEALKALSRAREKGVVIVRSTRAVSGAVLRNAEIDDDALGFIASDLHNPAKSRVLLALALTQTKDLAKIQDFFWDY